MFEYLFSDIERLIGIYFIITEFILLTLFFLIGENITLKRQMKSMRREKRVARSEKESYRHR